jgi:hypothetical protein
MTEVLDWKTVMQVAVFTVGVTQLLKQLFSAKSRVVMILLTMAVGVAGGLVLQFLPQWVFLTLLGVAVGTVFYDYVLKILERVLKGSEQ